MRTPKPNELWFNLRSNTVVLFKPGCTYLVNFPFSELLPGDTIVIKEYCLILANQWTVKIWLTVLITGSCFQK